MARRVEPNPFEDETIEPLTFDELTMLVFVCVTSLCLVTLLALGAWTAGRHLFFVLF